MTTLPDLAFDIVHPFDAHACAREVGLPQLLDPDRPRGLLIGNTRALWPRLLAARAAAPELQGSADPLDLFTEREVERARARLDGRAFYAHRSYAGAFLPFQRLAAAAGLAALAPTHLLVHPTFGPWFALRAVLLVAGEVVSPPRIEAPCRCDEGCLSAFADAREASGPEAWRAWLAVRDRCPVGRAYRYDDAQIGYHYTKDPRFLP